jgi:hypothetical protein
VKEYSFKKLHKTLLLKDLSKTEKVEILTFRKSGNTIKAVIARRSSDVAISKTV